MTLHPIPLNFLIYEERFIYFFISAVPWGEGHTRWRERGWESPNSDDGTYTVVLFVYTYFVMGTLTGKLWTKDCYLFNMFTPPPVHTPKQVINTLHPNRRRICPEQMVTVEDSRNRRGRLSAQN